MRHRLPLPALVVVLCIGWQPGVAVAEDPSILPRPFTADEIRRALGAGSDPRAASQDRRG